MHHSSPSHLRLSPASSYQIELIPPSSFFVGVVFALIVCHPWPLSPLSGKDFSGFRSYDETSAAAAGVVLDEQGRNLCRLFFVSVPPGRPRKNQHEIPGFEDFVDKTFTTTF
jgi:hypothetical protein